MKVFRFCLKLSISRYLALTLTFDNDNTKKIYNNSEQFFKLFKIWKNTKKTVIILVDDFVHLTVEFLWLKLNHKKIVWVLIWTLITSKAFLLEWDTQNPKLDFLYIKGSK